MTRCVQLFKNLKLLKTHPFQRAACSLVDQKSREHGKLRESNHFPIPEGGFLGCVVWNEYEEMAFIGEI